MSFVLGQDTNVSLLASFITYFEVNIFLIEISFFFHIFFFSFFSFFVSQHKSIPFGQMKCLRGRKVKAFFLDVLKQHLFILFFNRRKKSWGRPNQTCDQLV